MSSDKKKVILVYIKADFLKTRKKEKMGGKIISWEIYLFTHMIAWLSFAKEKIWL